MDRFSFRAAVHIAQAEFRQWLRSSRIIILFVMLVFVNVQVIGPLRQCKMLMGEMLSIPEAFVALGNSGVILLIIPILFLVLMADFPQRTGIDRFYQMRCTKRTWTAPMPMVSHAPKKPRACMQWSQANCCTAATMFGRLHLIN